MACRYLDQDFWDDAYVEEIPGLTRSLYVYLIISCPNACGIIERSVVRIARHLGQTESEAEAGLARLERDGKILRVGNHILLRNYLRRNWNPSPQTAAKIRRELRLFWHIKTLREGWVESNQRLPIGHLYPIDATNNPTSTQPPEGEVVKVVRKEGSGEKTKFGPPTKTAVTFDVSPLADFQVFRELFKGLEEDEARFWFDEAGRLAQTKGYTSRNWVTTICQWREEPNNRWSRHQRKHKAAEPIVESEATKRAREELRKIERSKSAKGAK